MVKGVVMERLREGRRLRTMGGGGGGRPIRPRWAGVKILWLPLFTSVLPASVKRACGRNHMAGKKRLFPAESGKYPGRGGKKNLPEKWTKSICGHCTIVLTLVVYASPLPFSFFDFSSSRFLRFVMIVISLFSGI